ncbi:hypothetical protein LMG14418_0103 [Lactococcus lactis subsp. lactis]|nr:hypothetical protein LMG14418_0103 [Lactococcus lactis subsp. lactis]
MPLVSFAQLSTPFYLLKETKKGAQIAPFWGNLSASSSSSQQY